MSVEVFEGAGASVEEALSAAQSQIPPRQGRDFSTSRVVEWGMQFGGFIPEKLYYVRIVEDPNAPFKTKP